MERLQKIIAESGYTSRRKAEELIKQGKVFVNGVKVVELGTKASFGDIITVNGVTLQKSDYVYFLLNKPRGVVSTAKDEKGRKTVVDLIDTDKRIYPIGRLDYDTTGLLLLTNDGELTNLLTHPKNKVPKKYVAKLNRYMEIEDLKKLEKGVEVEGRACTPTRVKLKKNDAIKNYAIVEITIIEGRNHIIKKVFENLGYLVDKLTRVEYAFLNVDKLKSGEYRSLTIKEVKNFMNIKIEKYDNQGRGIGYLNKKIVFVPNTVIGETVEIEIVEEKDKYIVGKVINVISPSTIRIKSKCPYYDRCGGCEFMHLSMDEELRIKTNILTDLLKRNNIDVPKINVIQSNNKYNYRNKVTLKIVNNEFGYYNSGTHNFTKIDYCYLAKDSINNIIKSYNLFKVSSGEITIRSNYNDEILIKIISNEKVDVDIEKLINDNKIVGIIVNDKVIYGENDYIEKVNNYLFKVNINSFFQVNLNILEKIEKILHAKKYHNVVDLYCGVGTLGMFVNKDKLYGIEIVKDAVINASINAKINKQNNMYMLGDSSKISKIDSDIDCIIIDPPRSGLNKETMKNIVTIKPDNLIYMSCNPLTFVRDMQILNKIYNVDEFYYLEMFPRTKHMECLAVLNRKH